MSQLVSVVMSAYNAERFVAQAVESVLAQTYRDFTFNITNDGSTDGTLAILQKYAASDSRVKLISRPNTGIVGAVNEGIAATNSKYIARMDADDVCLPERLEKQVAYLEAHPEVVALGARVRVIDPFDQVLFDSDHPADHEWIDTNLLAGRGWSLVQPVSMFRRETLVKVGGYRAEFNFMEDADLFLRMAEVGKLANLPDVLLLYRQHIASSTKTKFEHVHRMYEKCIRETYARRGLTLPDDWKFQPRIPPTAIELHRDWGWRALKKGQKSIARKHAYASIKIEPFSSKSWKLLLCAWRGH